MTRREFLERTIRGGFFVILAAISGFLILKEETDEVCELDFVCKSCKLNKNCTLEQAKNYRKK